MPRPGPRPYECVRRGWHSDRHQPVRGSIIQQIFRLVNETHSARTKKNKEWQEKLPIVVLKAEEIMYSKANSEDEYTNSDTLWDRVNDAINTIIRRDESMETGEFLAPCIEAALNLGCIPVKASRSQRHCNPRTYLTPRPQESVPVPLRVMERNNDKHCPQSLSPVQASSQFPRGTVTVNTTLPISESNCRLTGTSNAAASRSYPLPYENIPPGFSQSKMKETNKQLNSGSVYSLYYPQTVSQVPEKIPNTIYIGTPISASTAESAHMGVLQNFWSCPGAEISARRISQADFGTSHEKPHGMQCDLSLRLGIPPDSPVNIERSSVPEAKDGISSNSVDGNKFSDFSQLKNKELCFSPSRNTNDPFESCPVKWFSVGEGQNLDPTNRKRKAPLNDNLDAGQFCWQPEFPSNQFIHRIERPGS